jgi:hypothetical protein
MNADHYSLLMILFKLKSYLMSMIDDPKNCSENLEYTEEFLERKYPELKDEIIDLLIENDIKNDCEIAFNEKIQFVFKQIIGQSENHDDLPSILNKFQIDADELQNVQNKLDAMKNERIKRLDNILEILIILTKYWAQHQELENIVDDYSTLEEEDLIRPEEEEDLTVLDKNTAISFNHLSKHTITYLKLLTDYFFKYGGDISLFNFMKDLDNLKSNVVAKYSALFKDHGLDNDIEI